MSRKMSTWCVHICENTRRTTENIILNLHALVYRNIILHTNSVANLHIVGNIDILPERTFLAYHGTALYVTEMPYLCSFANLHIIINITRLMYKIFLIHCFIFLSFSQHSQVFSPLQDLPHRY